MPASTPHFESVTRMPEPRPLTRCPIVEALIDLRVSAAEHVAGDAFDVAAADMQQRGYSRKGSIREQKVLLTAGLDAMQHSSTESLTGARFHSADERFVAQFTTQGFTVSRLQPYVDWNSLVTEALALWRVYSAVARPSTVGRVATRYINELVLPVEPLLPLSEYLRAAPFVPADVASPPANFLQRYVVHDRETGAQAIVIQARQRPDTAEGIPVLLDLDCFVEKPFEPNDASAFAMLARLRNLKNRLFFGLVTDLTLRLYE